MATEESGTRYRSLTGAQALLAMAAFACFTAGCLIAARGAPPKLSSGKGPGDLALYSSVVERVRGGEGYYDALGHELRARDYPTHSVFNWRTPLHLELIAHLSSSGWALLLLTLGAVCAIGLAVAGTYRSGEHGIAGLQLVLLCIPLSIAAMQPIYLFSEVWAGVLIANSAALYALGRRNASAGIGVLALFFRELALPFVLIGLFFAWREKHKSEKRIWAGGLACYALYFGAHAMAVLSRIPPAGVTPGVSGWIQLGGLRFILMTSRVGLLMPFPYWVAALYLPLAVLGLAGRRNPVSTRLTATVIAYIAIFSVVGVPSTNFYWGGVYAPLLAFGTPWALPACRDLVRALRPGAARTPEAAPAEMAL